MRCAHLPLQLLLGQHRRIEAAYDLQNARHRSLTACDRETGRQLRNGFGAPKRDQLDPMTRLEQYRLLESVVHGTELIDEDGAPALGRVAMRRRGDHDALQPVRSR
jgi:hypothetical protein